MEKCTKDGKHQTVSRLIAQPGSTMRPKRTVFGHETSNDNEINIHDTPMAKLREYDNLN